VEAPILTPDQRLRVFVSSTLNELAAERVAVKRAISTLRLIPVMFEAGARPHAPRALYRAYLEQSQMFIGIYWQSYGWIAPEESISGIEDEYLLSAGKPKLIYIKSPAPDRDEALTGLIDRIKSDDNVSYRSFSDAEELEGLVKDDLALVLSESFAALPPEQPAATAKLRGLPHDVTSFVGREDQVLEIVQLLRRPEVRLVTLTGPGGIGKTRLATTAARTQGEFEDVAYVPLAEVSDSSLVPNAIADALGISESQGPVEDAIKRALQPKRLLLVIDNLEHVLESARLIGQILATAPGVKVLATSRALLRLRSEHEFPVPPLAESVRLFVDRARAMRPEFSPDDGDLRVIFAICDVLDHLPLAIELAAARIRVLTPSALLQRLRRDSDILTSSARDLPERQRTLRSTIEWSYNLLSPEEQIVFARLSVFLGSWSLEAAEAICNPDGKLDILETVASLFDKSLIATDPEGAEPRFRMLNVIREYARELLDDIEGETVKVRTAHADHFLTMARGAYEGLRGRDQSQWMIKLQRDENNFWVATETLLRQGRAAEVAEIGWSVWPYLVTHGRLEQGRGWAGRVLEGNPNLSDETIAKTEMIDGTLAVWSGDHTTAVTVLADAVERFRRAGLDDGVANALIPLGIALATTQGEDAGRAAMDESLEIFRSRKARGAS
jgi:predicted ATPase